MPFLNFPISQFSENVCTGRQLLLPIILQWFNIINNMFMFANVYFGISDSATFGVVMMVQFFVATILSLFVECSVIRQAPYRLWLNRNRLAKLKGLKILNIRLKF